MKRQLLLGAAVGVLAAIAPAAVSPARAASPVFTWTGFYVGANAGYSWGTGAVNYNDPALGGFGLPTSITGSNKLNGAIGGGQIGYNWQFDNAWVAGLEADLQAANEKGSTNFSYPYLSGNEGLTLSGSLSSSIQWFGTVRGRVGWLFNPTTMVYATGGLAYGRVTAAGSFSSSACATCMWSFNDAAINVGWTVGGGVEGAFPNSPNWTWKVEYLYIDLGSISGTGFDTGFGGPYSWNAKFTDNIFRVGANWHYP
jgi:outer membrane immunogenic protein